MCFPKTLRQEQVASVGVWRAELELVQEDMSWLLSTEKMPRGW